MKRLSFLSVLAAGLLVALVGSRAQADFTLDRSYRDARHRPFPGKMG
jgi:hypothetical protein